MTKAELLKALEAFPDDQEVYVSLHTAREPHGRRVDIQGVIGQPPPDGPQSDEPRRIALIAHADNVSLSMISPVGFRGDSGVNLI